jgi:hypothetical protein
MPCPPFDPQKVIARFQAGEWHDNADYWAVYRSSWQTQKKLIKLAERLRVFTAWDIPDNRLKYPDFKLEAAALEKEHIYALRNYKTVGIAYGKNFLGAVRLLKKGSPKWRFTLLAQVKLGIIHLRENHHQSEVDTTLLRGLIRDWQEKNGQRSASYDNQWYKILKHPEIVKLLRR